MNMHTFLSAPDLDGTDITARIPDDFRLQSGQKLDQTDVVARLYGPANAPVVVAAGGISAGRVLFAKEDATAAAPGWWEGVAGPGEALDLNVWRVLSIEFAPRLPANHIYTISTHDQARLVKLLLDHLGVERIYNFVGASYGAMIGLAFAELYPDAVERLCIISAAHRAHPMATAFRGLQRRLLMFGKETGRDAEGISLARQLAMTTYRSDAEFAERFDGPPPELAGDNYTVCGYLRARGDAYSATDVNRWIAMSDSLDRHRVDPARIKAKVFLAAVPTDRLVPYDDMKLLHNALADSVLVDFPSLYGHDAFLKEISAVSDIVRMSLS
ncbi:homoserine O-succinyltransferase [Asticcacaulis sp. AC402]|uniref:homoserine O-succinyltransferase MetX n=1 Tax=Asticcacaulis sp. AC402 TaxID=1282361 RepID=UPI0003C3C014|nr:homoserine O-succinyltransferase [Asticcacaulis sp. AC402]ESQ73926.1 alpha/beta hydrolase [Asticcacaulis sp. AC402]